MFAALQAQKTKLKQTETTETDKLGNKVTIHADGSSSVVRTAGFVVDTKPDPQVAYVMDGLFVGSQDATGNIDGLKENKVTHILNLVEGINPAFPDQFTYKTIPILDVEESSLSTILEECFQYIDEAKTKGTGCLVHCNAGVSRSTSVVLVRLPFFFFNQNLY